MCIQDLVMWERSHLKFIWNYSPDQLGALILEVGTEAHHGSFAAFKEKIKNNASVQLVGADQLEYTSTVGNTITMEFVSPTTYTFTQHNCTTKTIDPAGVPARLWGDGEFIDYHTWDSYRVVYGEPIIEQQWGSGTMKLQANGQGVQIRVDPVGAELEYATFSPGDDLLREPDNPADTVNGIEYQYYEGSWNRLPNFDHVLPVETGVANSITINR
jgi:hypothetical protein